MQTQPVVAAAPPTQAPARASVTSGTAPAELSATARVRRPAGPGELERYGTGSKVGAPLEEIPATVSIVDERTFRERGTVDLQQALTVLPGIMPLWTYGGFQYITSRGFQAVTLYDGRRDSRAVLARLGASGRHLRPRAHRGPARPVLGTLRLWGSRRRRESGAQAAIEHAAYELDLGLGLPNQKRAHVGAQGRLGKMLAYRVDMAQVTHQDFRGARTDRTQLTTSLRFTPTHKNTLNVRVSYANDRYNTDVGIPTIEDPRQPGRWRLPPHTNLQNRYSSRHDHLDYQRLELSGDYRYAFTDTTYLEARASITRDHYAYLAAESLTYVPPTGTTPAQVQREYLYFARGWLPVFAALELHSDLHTGPLRHQLVGGYSLDAFSGASDRSDLGGAVPRPSASPGRSIAPRARRTSARPSTTTGTTCTRSTGSTTCTCWTT